MSRFTQPAFVDFKDNFSTKGNRQIIYISVNRYNREHIKDEIEHFIRIKSYPNKERLGEKMVKDFSFDKIIQQVMYPDADKSMEGYLILILNDYTEEEYGSLLQALGQLPDYYGVVGFRKVASKGAITAKTKYTTNPTYISKEEIPKLTINTDPKYTRNAFIFYKDVIVNYLGFKHGKVILKKGKELMYTDKKNIVYIGFKGEVVKILGDPFLLLDVDKAERTVKVRNIRNKDIIVMKLENYIKYTKGSRIDALTKSTK